ncbi:MAG: hypothetical protein RDO_0550 [Flavobacteriales endosymbiont of Rhyzopertha dominica]|nr:MAG: DNA-directed RNA polymerase subunit beta [Candidatus Shikimatogenerans bostrichidophilus]
MYNFKYNKIIEFKNFKYKIKYQDFLKYQIKSFKKIFNLKTLNKKKTILFKILKKYFNIKNKNITIKFKNYYLIPPKYNIKECLYYKLTYNININIKLEIKIKINNKYKKIIKNIYLFSCPFITNTANFIFNGIERVVIFQLIKSPGILFNKIINTKLNNTLYIAKIIPKKGSWIEVIIDNNYNLYILLNKTKKIPINIFLNSIWFKNNKNIIKLFNNYKKVKVNINNLLYKINLFDIIINNKIILNKYKIINKKIIKILIKNKINYIYIFKNINNISYNIIINNFKNTNISYKKNLIIFYKIIKNVYIKNYKIVKKFIIKKFFNKKEYDLGKIGRYKLNTKLKIKLSHKIFYITKTDIIHIINKLINFINNNNIINDSLYNLSNRIVIGVGDQIYNILNKGLLKIHYIIKEKIKFKNNETIKLNNKIFINSKILNTLINTFFGTSQFSQYMEQINPLSEITHKRRITLLGPGGITKNKTNFETRDINYSFYGKICPIETPEGPNIGLISSLCLFAKISNMGFLKTPYRNIKTNKIHYLNSDEELNKIFIPLNVKLKNRKSAIFARKNNSYNIYNTKKILYRDYSQNQMVSITVGLIPFLEHNDVNRALMGSNMMRQATPLLIPEAPIVGTGLEKYVVYYSRNFINAKSDGIIKYVDSKKIIVKYNFKDKNINFYNKYYTHYLKKFQKTNQNTCINLRPIIKKGEKIKKNQILCEGFGTKNKELALGRNILVAFMNYKGYNFEDSILISNRLIKEDYFTSITIEEYKLEIRKNKLGNEKFTRNIPNISKSQKNKLNKNGIIKIGTEVKPGDILIGKIVPKEGIKITPEIKLLKSIFGEKMSNIKDNSLRAHSTLYGKVINYKIFYNKKKKNYIKIKNKIKYYFIKIKNKLFNNLCKKVINIIKNKKIIKKFLNKLKFKKINFKNFKFNKKKIKIIKLLITNYNLKYYKLYNYYKRKISKIFIDNELSTGIIKVAKVYIAQKRKLKVGDKMSGRYGNKGVVSKIINEEDMPYLKDGTIIDIILNPLSIPSRMNLGQILESILGLIGYKKKIKFYNQIFNRNILKIINKYSNNFIKNYVNTTLYDGITGEKLDNKVSIGIIYMFKLNHMVDDKLHARSIGPYSLITQQPLGGKSKFGGQRFGEMEVWALEAYGASNLLKEMLTIKSDDIIGRKKTYESIINNKKLPNSNIPEAFNVLKYDLKGLCIDLKIDYKKK